jgi:hypothetical protein
MADSSRRPCLRASTAPSRSDRGLLDLPVRQHLVGELRSRADGERLFLPPRDLAERAGFEVVVTASLGTDELAEPAILYVWHPDMRERGIRVYCGLSRLFLRGHQIPHTSYDVWRFALDLAVPVEAHRAGVERLSRAQTHCPVEVIAGVIAGRW